MEYLRIALQIIVALGIFNVWLLRSGKATPYRGGGAMDMRQEFARYGLPPKVMYIVGALKLGCAVALLVGILVPVLVQPAAALLAALMSVAVAMHLKIKDPTLKSLPAAAMLALCLLILVL